jgi:hypothetical protein
LPFYTSYPSHIELIINPILKIVNILCHIAKNTLNHTGVSDGKPIPNPIKATYLKKLIPVPNIPPVSISEAVIPELLIVFVTLKPAPLNGEPVEVKNNIHTA